MLKETFYLDGVDARSVGIQLQKPVDFDGIKPVVIRQSIPGRNGDLVFDTGAFKNRAGNAACYILQKKVIDGVDAAAAFLLSKPGYRKLTTSDDPDHYWMARVENGVHIEQRLRLLNPFKIKFDCKPQRFVVGGDQPVTVSSSPSRLQNPHSGTALPKITVYGNGAGTVTVNGVVVDIKSMSGSLIIDCDTQNVTDAYGKNENNNIKADNFPSLKPGQNTVAFSGGVTSLSIIPRWWDK